MTKTWKSILSLLLALVMLFGIPNCVIADSSSLGNDYWDVQDDVGFLIDGKTYNLALSKKSYNGVPSGASFFVNDGKIVVDATTIEKLANAQTIFAFHRNGAMDIVVNSEDVNAALNCINQLGDVLVTNTIGSTLWTFSKFAVGAFDGTGNVLDFINNIVNEDMVFYVGVLIAEDNTSRELINILNQLSVLLQAYNQMDRKAIKYEMLIALDSCISLAISRQEELKSIGKRIYSRYGDEAGYNGVNIWGAINSYGSAILSDIETNGMACLIDANAAEEISDLISNVKDFGSLIDGVSNALDVNTLRESYNNFIINKYWAFSESLSTIVNNSRKLSGLDVEQSSGSGSSTGSSTGLNEEHFLEIIAELRNEYPHKQYWNQYNGKDSEGIAKAGPKKCSGESKSDHASCVSHGYCAYGGECTCLCGYFHGWQCFGFGNLMAYKVFGSYASDGYKSSNVNSSAGWKYVTSTGNYYAGDVVRIDNNSHTIFLTKVTDKTAYYVDCNAYHANSPCQIAWDNSISLSSLKSRTSYIFHKDGNTLKGTASAPTLTITYNANGGENQNRYRLETEGIQLRLRQEASTNSTILDYIDDDTVIEVTETKEAGGYTWGKTTYKGKTGWAAISDTTSKYDVSDDGTIVNHWTNAIIADTWKYGESHKNGLTNATNTFLLKKDGYTFAGWSLDKDNPTMIFGEDDPLNAENIVSEVANSNQSCVLYAIWQINDISATYTIKYNANGGDDAPKAQTKTHGTTLALSNDIPTRDGYTFLGWAESSEATDAVYQPGESFTKNADVTLYAVWENSYKYPSPIIELDLNKNTVTIRPYEGQTEKLRCAFIIRQKTDNGFENGHVDICAVSPNEPYVENLDEIAAWKLETFGKEWVFNGKIYCQAAFTDITTDENLSDFAKTEEFDYEYNTVLKTPTNLSWENGIAHWVYEFNKYYYPDFELYYSSTSEMPITIDGLELISAVANNLGDDSAEVELSKPGYYYFRVKAKSEDNTKYQDSEWTELSPAYKYDPQQSTMYEYKIESITLKDNNNNVLSSIPKSKFFADVKVMNISSTDSDMLLLAYYNNNGKMLGMSYLFVNQKIGESSIVSISLDNSDGEIAMLKAFMLPADGNAIPLSEAAVIGFEQSDVPVYIRGDDSEIYNSVLGDYAALMAEAEAESDLDTRYVKYAKAEAELLDSAVMIPTTTQGGAYTISRVAPHTVPFVQWGNDDDRLFGMVISDDFISKTERTDLLELWENAVAGNGTYDPAAYLTSKGHTIKNSYATTFSTPPVTLDWLDTSAQSDTESLVNCVDGLVQYDNLGTMQPALAESWEISEDGLTYTFHIRQGVKWYTYEGKEYADVTAHDFVNGFRHMLDVQAGLEWLVEDKIAGAVEYLSGLCSFDKVGYKATDDYTLVITLEKPTPYFMTMLTYSCFLPYCESFANSCETFGYSDSPANQVYCGPYLIKIISDNEIRLEKNPDYYGAEKVILESISWFADAGESSLATFDDVINGKYAGIGLSLSTGTLEYAIEKDLFDTYAYVSDTTSTSYFGALNLNRGTFELDNGAVESPKTEREKIDTHTALLNKNFRKALQHAFDKASYNAVSRGADLALTNLRNMYTHPEFVVLSKDVTLDGHTFKEGTFYGDIVQYFIGSEIDVHDQVDGWYNPTLAKSYLEAAKVELSDTVTFPIKIDVVYYSASDANTAQANAYKAKVEETLGAENVVVNLVEATTSADFYASGYSASTGEASNFDMFYGSGWGPDYGDPSTYLDTFLGDGNGYMTAKIGLF